MSFNLLQEPFLAVRCLDGRLKKIPVWQISDPNVLALAAPRADFNAALVQFILGLLQTAFAPEDEDEWLDFLLTPPTPETLQSRFQKHEKAFELLGDQPCFMQDFESQLEGEAKPIAALLIETPGGNTLKQNTDHFIKRGQAAALCPCCAATALFTLQTNAPAGGVGHRTSLRGGGPLTTLVCADPLVDDEDTPSSLWRDLWLNVLLRSELESSSGNASLTAESATFPWLAATRSSEKSGVDTTPEDVHPLQMYWGMPRRIRLLESDLPAAECAVCGEVSDSLIEQFVTRNYGVNYSGAWRHPLSPHYSDKQGMPLCEHPQPGGFPYRYWLTFSQDNKDENRSAATIVQRYNKRKIKEAQLRLWVFGYDMDNMKARCWHEGYFPLYIIDDAERRTCFIDEVRAMLLGAKEVEGYVRGCIKEAWFKRPKDHKGDVSFLTATFYQRSEAAFYRQLAALSTVAENKEQCRDLMEVWYQKLSLDARALFDEQVVRGGIVFSDPQRISAAHKKLSGLLRGKKIRAVLNMAPLNKRSAT
ncbi:MAG: type I-E CRISPR-associated protein Cse1/CasA [Gammaproteobacteria bacterium]|nr:type I-E CRISPR-associated protein Cse1/CasA [Gammaproteobacteria bacterium]